ncbi:MAG: hypothetical protein ACLVJ6_03970 [Merdibacter sp.]
MLEVLDPEQNSVFSDHYIEEHDLSKVLFIATANYRKHSCSTAGPSGIISCLPIRLEKVKIAKEHLLPKQLEKTV